MSRLSVNQNHYIMQYSLSLFLFLISVFSFAQSPLILTQRDQARVIDELLEDRLRNTLPGLMRKEGIDMWVVISREYNEDPVIETLLPATWMAARRTTMLIAFDHTDKEMEYLAVARYDVGKTFKRAWDPDANPINGPNLERSLLNAIPEKSASTKRPPGAMPMDFLPMTTTT